MQGLNLKQHNKPTKETITCSKIFNRSRGATAVRDLEYEGKGHNFSN